MRRLAFFFALAVTAAAAQPPVVQLNAGIHLIRAEVAADYGTRMTGLMHRVSMPANAGMLFVFDELAMHCMWMKNTLIPLSVAFIDEAGAIINVEDMKPQTLDSHCSKKPVRFVLEMNQVWFAKRGIKSGDKLSGTPFGR